MLDRDIHERRVGNVAVAISKGQFFGFQEQMQVISRLVAQGLEIKAFQYIKHLQRGDALRIGGKFIDLVAAIGSRERLNPIRVVLLHILQREQTTALLYILCNGSRQGTPIKSIATFLHQRAIGAGEMWLEQNVSSTGRFAARHKYASTTLPLPEYGLRSLLQPATEFR